MINREAFFHKVNFVIPIVFFLCLLAIAQDIFQKNTHLDNFTGMISTFISTSQIYWALVLIGCFFYLIPLVILAIIDVSIKNITIRSYRIKKIFSFIENCPFILINSLFALTGSILALSTLMLFTPNPIANFLACILVGVFIYIFSLTQLSIILDLNRRFLNI